MITASMESSKSIACEFLELVSEGNVDALCEMITPDWEMHIGLGTFEIPRGQEGIRTLFGTFGKIKQQWEIEQVIAEGSLVVARATNYCEQESFLGVPSHGKPQVFTATFIHSIVNGKIKETWRNADDLGRVLQLGATIVPASA